MYLSKYIEDAVNELAKLPGVGKKTAFRYVLHLMDKSSEEVSILTKALGALKGNIYKCSKCNVSNDSQVCAICSNMLRDQTKICVVENLRDLLAIENTGEYRGLYHVLDGIISPIDGVGPDDLSIDMLDNRIASMGEIELIMALNPTIEGDTTIFYLSNRFKKYPVEISIISRGIAFGGELDYTDALTIGRSMQARRPFEQLIRK